MQFYQDAVNVSAQDGETCLEVVKTMYKEKNQQNQIDQSDLIEGTMAGVE